MPPEEIASIHNFTGVHAVERGYEDFSGKRTLISISALGQGDCDQDDIK